MRTVAAVIAVLRRRGRAGTSVLAVIRLAWLAAPGLLVMLLAVAATVAVLAPLTLILIQRLVDAIGTGASVVPIVGLIAAATTMKVATDGFVSMKQQELAACVSLTSEQRLLSVVGAAPLERMWDAEWYDRVARARDGVTWRPALATGTVVSLAGSLASATGLIAIIGALDVRLLSLAVLSAVPVLIYRRSEIRTMYRIRAGNTELDRRRDYLFGTVLQAGLAREIRGYGLLGHFVRRHGDLARAALDRERAVHGRIVGRSIVAGVSSAALLVLAYLLISTGGTGAMSAGELFLACAAFATLTDGVAALAAVFTDLEEHAAYLTDYLHLVTAGPIDEAGAPRPATPPRVAPGPPPDIEFRDVSFRYPGGSLVVDRLSFRIEAGQTVVLMGSNGAGKSTLISLMLGLLTPESGVVLLGGVDIRELGPVGTRATTGGLFQEYGHYELTIGEGVGLGRIEVPLDRDAATRALQQASLSELTAALPDGIDTAVGHQFPGSRDLSTGQWQRLALARLLYRDAPMWALDEPTAALDSAAEVRFLRHLKDDAGRRTVVIVTHRLETARIADRILLLRAGRLVEDGTHNELLRNRGQYAELCADFDELFEHSDAQGHPS